MSNPQFDGLQQQNFNCAQFALLSLQTFLSLPLSPSLSHAVFTFFCLSLHFLFLFSLFSDRPPRSPPSSSGALCKFQNIPESRIELAWNGISKRDNFHYKIAPSSLLSSVKANISPRKSLYMFGSAFFSFSLSSFLRQPCYILQQWLAVCMSPFTLNIKAQVWPLKLQTLLCQIHCGASALMTNYKLSHARPSLSPFSNLSFFSSAWYSVSFATSAH